MLYLFPKKLNSQCNLTHTPSDFILCTPARNKNPLFAGGEMKLRTSRIEYIAQEIIRILTEEEFLIVFDQKEAVASVQSAISEDLAVEDKLDEEVRELLEAHEAKMDISNIHYHEMFKLVKSRLAKERGLIL
jgi:uncharacterized protein